MTPPARTQEDSSEEEEEEEEQVYPSSLRYDQVCVIHFKYDIMKYLSFPRRPSTVSLAQLARQLSSESFDLENIKS